MEENSHFGNPLPSEQPMLEQLYSVGSTCDAYRVRLYGKLHFLKRLKQQHVNDIRFVEAFQKEFEVGYGLEHPNLIRYLSFSDDGILMEYVDGETLTDFLLSHPNYFKVQAHSDKFVRQMLSVMQYLHDHRVLHLDLKPDNILITRIGHDVKLVDLGGCYTDCFDSSTAHTDAYAAPEQLSGEVVDARTDLYAFGRILQQIFSSSSSIYDKVIARCTQYSPSDRYQSAEEIMRMLDYQRHLKKQQNLASILAICAVIIGIFLINGITQLSSVLHSEVPQHADTLSSSKPDYSSLSLSTKPLLSDILAGKHSRETHTDLLSDSVNYALDAPVHQSIKKPEINSREWKKICSQIQKGSDQLSAKMSQKIEQEGISPIDAYANYYQEPFIALLRSIVAQHPDWEFAIGSEANKYDRIVLDNVLAQMHTDQQNLRHHPNSGISNTFDSAATTPGIVSH